jgi:hypothetical protein
MTGRARGLGRVTAVALALTALVACNDDDGGGGGGSGGVTTPPNALTVEMFDHGYGVTGTVTSGAVTITTSNTGREWHMASYGRLQPGRTVADVAALLDAQVAGNTDQGIDTVIERGLGGPGHLLQPGRRQSITLDTLDTGSYVMLCYLPVEGEGTPHFSKGMVGGFEVGAGPPAAPPQEADVELTLGDSAEPVGMPQRLKSGTHTFKVVSTGTASKDFTVSQLGTGATLGSFAIYFATEFPKAGGPPVGVADLAPGRVLGSAFQIEAGHTVWLTIDIPAGQTYFDSATNVAGGNPIHKVVSLEVD